MPEAPRPVPDVPATAAADPAVWARRLGRIGHWQQAAPGGELVVSAAAAQLLGAGRDEGGAAVPWPLPRLLACIDAADRPAVAAAFAQAFERDIDLVCRTQAAPGRWLQLRSEGRPGAGSPAVEGTLQDIGALQQIAQEQAAAAQARSASAARDAAVLAAVPDLWFVLSGEGRYLEVSRSDHPSLAAPWAELRGRLFAEVIAPAVAAPISAALARARAQGAMERVEYTLRTVSGEQRQFEARIVPLADRGWLYLTRDITESVAMQQSLRESEARYARALRGTSDGLWDWDVVAGRHYLSPRCRGLLGLGPEPAGTGAGTAAAAAAAAPAEAEDTTESALARDGFFGRIHPDETGAARGALHAHFRHGAPFDLELRLRTGHGGDGEHRWFRVRGETERDAAGQPLHMAGSIADITMRKQIEDALRDSQAKFSALFHIAPVGIGLTSLEDGRAVEVNEEMARMIGWSVEEMVGREGVELGIWLDPKARAALVAEVREHGRGVVPDLVMRHRSGRPLHVKLAVQQLTLGGRALLLSAVTDLTERNAAERALREQREAYAAIFNAASDAIVSVDEQGRILLFNPGAERIFGRSAAELAGRPLHDLLPSALSGGPLGDIARFAATGEGGQPLGAGRVQGLDAQGRALELEASISQATVAGRQVLTAILRDVTARVQAEAESQRYQAELSALTRQLMAQEKLTTQRLAQALHDQLGQTLTALRLGHDRDRRAAADAAEASAQAQRRSQTGALIDQAIREVRQVLVDLRPPLLEEEGLFAALDNELAARGPRHPQVDLLLEVDAELQHQRWPADVEYALFMIAREAVDNALRHAGATLVRVALEGGPGEAALDVTDDGVGIGPGAERARPGHLGLIGMRERARAIGAQLRLVPASPGGTRLEARWRAPAAAAPAGAAGASGVSGPSGAGLNLAP